VAGFLPGPGSAVYYASKAYVVSLGEALHHEMARRGIRVTTLCPGPVHTEFHIRAGFQMQRMPLLDVPAAQVAEEGYRGLMAGRRVVIPGLGSKLVTWLPHLIPRSLLLYLIDRRQRARIPEART
jgi:short-subunit dehydrogenase